MMAPKLSGDAVLGGHHLYVTPRTMTGVIRTATRNTKLPRNAEEASRSFAMAAVCIAAAMKITGCGPGSQSVKLILLLIEISRAYARDFEGARASRTDFLKLRDTTSARGTHLKLRHRNLYARTRADFRTGAQMAARDMAFGRSFSSAHSDCSLTHRRLV